MSSQVMKPTTAYVVAVTATSAAQTAPITFGVDTVRIVSTSNCWVKLGSGTPVADKTTSAYVPLGQVELFAVNPTGKESLAVIRDTADGSLSITEMSR